MTIKAKVNGSRKAWVPAVVAIIGLGGYLGFTQTQIQELQNHVPAVAAFLTVIGQAVLTYATGNRE